MVLTNSNIVILINFLHCAAAGLVLPVLPRTIYGALGTHIVSGFLHSLIYICQLVTTDLLQLLPEGKRYSLKFCLFCCFTYYFILAVYKDWITAFIIRCLYALTTDVLLVSKEFIEKTEPEETHIRIFNFIDIAKTAGLAIGSIVGGYIFQYDEHYSPTGALMACTLIFVCNVLMQLIDSEDIYENTDSILQQLPTICYERVMKLKEIEITENFLLQQSVIFSFSLYLSCWVHFFCYNYEASAIYLGYAIAFEHLTVFLSNCLVPFIREKIEDELLFKISIFISGTAILGILCAPNYYVALFIFGIVILMYTIKNSLFDEDILDLKSEDNLYEASKTCTVLTNVIVPIFARTVADLFGDEVVKFIIFFSVFIYTFLGYQMKRRSHIN